MAARSQVSDCSSESSSSPPESPQDRPHFPPSLERLLEHFVSAKRSLGAKTYVGRANDMVTKSRASLEDMAVIHARNHFAGLLTHGQIETLHGVRESIGEEGRRADHEFKELIAVLDKANSRLQKTLQALQITVVDAELRRKNSQSSSNLAEDGVNSESSSSSKPSQSDEKTLFDFIDETKHVEVQSSIRESIDAFNEARKDLFVVISAFDDHIQVLSGMLEEPAPSPGPVLKATIYDDPPESTPQLFRSMDEHAAEMATLLESLVSHYDLCVTALKHTEGGGQAAKNAATTEQLPNPTGAEESLYGRTNAEPMDETERIEMLRVLDTDARTHVDDVVNEIRTRHHELETLSEQLSRRNKGIQARDRMLRNVLEVLHEMHDIHLPSHLHAMATFQASWARIQSSVRAQAEELDGYSTFYAGFLNSYSKLLLEVERRNRVEAQMRTIAEKAQRDIRKLHEGDDRERRGFMEEVGRFLPTDLWPGSSEDAVRWEIQEVTGRSAQP